MIPYQRTDNDDVFSAEFDADRIAGCLLGGAAGDALGVPVAPLRLDEICERFGDEGITEPLAVEGAAAVSDDTQMSLFTAEGLLRAVVCDERHGGCNPIKVLYHAYLRWLHTQGMNLPGGCLRIGVDGWLVKSPSLFARRAPTNACLAALGSGRMGSLSAPINDSKASGAAARVAPIGLVPSLVDTFALGADAVAITHGHPSAYLSGGAFAAIIRSLMQDASLEDAAHHSISLLVPHPGHKEVRAAIERAVYLARYTLPSAQVIEALGGGWVAEEALAIAVYCAMAHADDFVAGVRLAANHSGDSDTTAAMTGNLLGAKLGRDAIPESWLEHLELRDEIEIVSRDLATGFCGEEEWASRYPGW